MTRPMLFAVFCAVMGACAVAHAQSSPIPDSRVPGLGGSGPSASGGSPASSGSSVGSNVGAGANASPSVEIVTPARPASDEAVVPPPAGTSGSLTITK